MINSSNTAKRDTPKLEDVLDIKTLLLLLPNSRATIERYKNESLEVFVIDVMKEKINQETREEENEK